MPSGVLYFLAPAAAEARGAEERMRSGTGPLPGEPSVGGSSLRAAAAVPVVVAASAKQASRKAREVPKSTRRTLSTYPIPSPSPFTMDHVTILVVDDDRSLRRAAAHAEPVRLRGPK